MQCNPSGWVLVDVERLSLSDLQARVTQGRSKAYARISVYVSKSILLGCPQNNRLADVSESEEEKKVRIRPK